jgi:hypothetical protein
VAPLQRRLGPWTAVAAATSGTVGFALSALATSTGGWGWLLPASVLLGRGQRLVAGGRAVAGGAAGAGARRGALTGVFYTVAYLGFAAPFVVTSAAGSGTGTAQVVVAGVLSALLARGCCRWPGPAALSGSRHGRRAPYALRRGQSPQYRGARRPAVRAVSETLLNVGLIAVFILAGAVFSGAEIALVSLREGQVKAMAEKGRRGEKVAHLTSDPNRFLAAVQVGVTLAGFLSAAFGAATLASSLAPVLVDAGLPRARPTRPRWCSSRWSSATSAWCSASWCPSGSGCSGPRATRRWWARPSTASPRSRAR